MLLLKVKLKPQIKRKKFNKNQQKINHLLNKTNKMATNYSKANRTSTSGKAISLCNKQTQAHTLRTLL